tara:strand:- start:1170 stop:2663 length:1494 start_codon:yes stop_codon:yes gene_type:complete
MKNLKYLIYLSTIIATFSCSELEEEPYGFLANDNFYSTEENVYSGLQYAYQASKRAQFYSRLLNITLMGAGQSDTKPSYTQRNAVEFKNWTFDASTEALRDFFGGCYTGISRANTVLDNTEKIDFSDDILKNQYIGEAKFLRAFYYFYLVRVFGEVPVYTDAKNPNITYETPVSSIEDIYNLIIDDLTFAAQNVPAFSIRGRADGTAAKGLLSKVYLHLASSKESGSPRYGWVSDHTQMYAQAASFASQVLNSGTFGLDNSIYTTFPDNNPASREKLFVWSSNPATNNSTGMTSLHTTFSPYTWYSQFYTYAPGSTDVTPYWGGWTVMWYHADELASHPSEDLRRNLYTNLVLSSGGAVLQNRPESYNMKYFANTQSFYSGDTSWPFLRTSDIALVHAEAAGPTADGYSSINAIRNRAGLADLTPGLSRSEYMEAVWQERKWELAMEGHLIFDLRRTKRVDSELGSQVNFPYFHPLPQREVDLNNAIELDPEKQSLR